ncbi:MAG: nucleotide exchange factor GrpE [Planctomycetaceae bacterium]|nr:nucleotide exchange factor GrpE [Planctomycetaceae bacterium]
MTDQDSTNQIDEGFSEDDQPVASSESQESAEASEENSETVPMEIGMREVIAKLLSDKKELEDRLARSQAELVNYRRRSQNETAQFRKYEGLSLVRDLLPAVDNLNRAVDASQAATSVDDLKQGVEMVVQQMLDVITRYSVEVIPTQGEVFDPNIHEALQQVPSEEVPAMHVVQELEAGYRMHDRIVRPSKVIVSTGPAETTEE